jgi:hypothetical protein
LNAKYGFYIWFLTSGLVIYCHLYFLQNVAKSEDNFPDVFALPGSLSMFGCEILCY